MNSSLNFSWRDALYHRLYAIIDQLVYELQEHVWIKTGKFKGRLKGYVLERVCYSVECLVRDCKITENCKFLSLNIQEHKFEKIQNYQKETAANSVLEAQHFELENYQQSLAIRTF